MRTLVLFPDDSDELVDSLTKERITTEVNYDILHIWDSVDDEDLVRIFKKFSKPKKYIFCDAMSAYKTNLDVNIYCADMWIESELSIWEQKTINLPFNPKTMHAANFQINKKQIHRFLAIKFCEIFNVDVDYTWSGIGKNFDLSHIIEEKTHLDNTQINRYWGEILAPIYKFDKKWITVNDNEVFGPGVHQYGENYEVWNGGLDNLMSTTAISLITETIWTQNAATYTEKTAYSLLALTFPIWVGGFNAASEWKKKGFDTFDDIIDHSYQDMPTLLERCFYAFYLNLDVLTNVNLAAELRDKHMDRLIENRNKLTSENLKNYNRKVISTWPNDLQQPALESMYRYLKLK